MRLVARHFNARLRPAAPLSETAGLIDISHSISAFLTDLSRGLIGHPPLRIASEARPSRPSRPQASGGLVADLHHLSADQQAELDRTLSFAVPDQAERDYILLTARHALGSGLLEQQCSVCSLIHKCSLGTLRSMSDLRSSGRLDVMRAQLCMNPAAVGKYEYDMMVGYDLELIHSDLHQMILDIRGLAVFPDERHNDPEAKSHDDGSCCSRCRFFD